MTSTGPRLLVIGLTGPIAGGKSLVASMLSELGAQVLDADRISHDVLGSDEIVKQVVANWGLDVLDDKGQLDRKKLAEEVFADVEEVRRLESIVHPEVCRRIISAIETERARSEQDGPPAGGRSVDPQRRIVIDAPLLFEAGLDQQCDCIVFVDAPEEVRVQRALKTRDWDRKELHKRERHQKSSSSKCNRADIVITNNDSTSELQKQVEKLWSDLSHHVFRPVSRSPGED